MSTSAAPRATFTVSGTERTVIFDFERLIEVESATGKTVIQILNEFASYAATPDGREPTPEEQRAAAERFSVTAVGRFVAGCLSVPASSLVTADVRLAFVTLLPAFVEAVQQLNGDGVKQDPQPAPQPSGG